MNFKDAYKSEMNHIKRNRDLDEQVLAHMEEPERRRGGYKKWKLVVAAAAMVCVVVVAVNFQAVAGMAKSIFGSYKLTAGNEEMELGEIVALEFDVEAFIADENTEKHDTGSYNRHYENCEEMQELTGIILPGADTCTYEDITIAVDTINGYGHLSMEVVYNGVSYPINGMFALDGFHQDEWGYGEENSPVDEYAYAEGKKAYFVEDQDYDDLQKVYFSEGNILFQLFVDKGDSGVTVAKGIIGCMIQ